jgi:nicotinamidase-related amidase
LAEILTIGDRDVFLAVDLQNDFCPGVRARAQSMVTAATNVAQVNVG